MDMFFPYSNFLFSWMVSHLYFLGSWDRGDWILWDAACGFMSRHDNGLQMKDVDFFVQFYSDFEDSVPNYKSIDKHNNLLSKSRRKDLST